MTELAKVWEDALPEDLNLPHDPTHQACSPLHCAAKAEEYIRQHAVIFSQRVTNAGTYWESQKVSQTRVIVFAPGFNAYYPQLGGSHAVGDWLFDVYSDQVPPNKRPLRFRAEKFEQLLAALSEDVFEQDVWFEGDPTEYERGKDD